MGKISTGARCRGLESDSLVTPFRFRSHTILNTAYHEGRILILFPNRVSDSWGSHGGSKRRYTENVTTHEAADVAGPPAATSLFRFSFGCFHHSHFSHSELYEAKCFVWKNNCVLFFPLFFIVSLHFPLDGILVFIFSYTIHLHRTITLCT